MKITCSPPSQICGTQAMTLAEMMVSITIFMLLMGGFISVNLFGMRQDQLVNSAMGANDQARLNFNLMMDEIRACKNIQIGHGDYTSFVALTNGPQQGESLQIIPSTNLGMFIYYWFDTNNNKLWRAGITNGVTTTNIVAQYLTNQTSQWLTNSMTFRAMDYTGTTNLTVDPTNYNYNYGVNVVLQFAHNNFPMTMVGSNYLYNYYQLTYSAARRSP